MKYKAPTEEAIKLAIEEGWDVETATRGYDITMSGCFNNLLVIERVDAIYENSNITDEDCARHAAETGFCKIIPVEDLPKGLPEDWYLPVFVDEPENRERLKNIALSKEVNL